MKYTGFLPALVSVFDNASQVFAGTVLPGATFALNGQSNGKFAGNDINLFVIGIWNASIKTSCGLDFDPATRYGLFMIVSATSKNGGTLCCSSNGSAGGSPDIAGCPANIDVAPTANCGATVTWTPPIATSCDLQSFTSTHQPGSVFPIGSTKVIYTAKDGNGKSSTCNFNVTVRDRTGPTLVNALADVTVSTDATCKAAATWPAPAFVDECTVSSVTSSHTSGSIFPLGNTVVTYTAKDNSGNTSTFRFSVVVKDQTAPVASRCPTEVVVKAKGGCRARVSWDAPLFVDDCSAVTVTASHNPGSDFPVGETEVIYSAKDKSNNTTVCKFNVVVQNETPPVFSRCPEDITRVTSTGTGETAVEWRPPSVRADCGMPSVVASHKPGDLFLPGTTTVRYTATDISGNVSTCSFQVTVKWEDSSLDIIQLVTPDGNGTNDWWLIGNIEKYATNKVVVVDQFGSVVYSATGYDNDKHVWNGENKKGELVPTGTYFYTISLQAGPSVVEKTGFIEVVR
ncbi:HYR domain-containing protein [Chryseolinea lacunae]|uniref:HYR domain-containing protein n=1 Tax=Chryseolinea lacunae TaxID=2801331 RepID=A0ABS1KNF8_9BACT|nr:HYR domain-containing protein [Chryseolinea lacunae]MBL0741018.1 HYR domain-containing protein [Chryseolinea lacunae]